jgi:hypothetical protein
MDEAGELVEQFLTDHKWLTIGDPGAPTQDRFDKSKAAIIAAIRKAGGVPEGWQLVPVRANTDMGKAFYDAAPYAMRFFDGYKAMLAAAPQPPALDRDGIIEACAKVVEGADYLIVQNMPPETTARDTIKQAAAAIRAMKGRT